MGKDNGWQRLGELSKILQTFRHMYLHRQADEDHPALGDWRRKLRLFFKDLLLSCGLAAREEEGTPWVHYQFDTFCPVLTHSYCDWSSADAFGCGLMPEVLDALLEVQSELPVCAPAIVQVLLQRLATLRPACETKRSFTLLVKGLERALDACPAMPGAALEASIEICLRRPSLDASWSLRATRMFVRGLLSLVSRSPRSLCQSVVPVLVRLVSERECDVSDSQDLEEGSPRALPCISCAGSDIHLDDANAPGEKARPLRCNAHAKRDVVLEGLLRWAVDIHFRRCSRVLQASFYRAACDGVRQALDAATVASGRVCPPSFPLACRLLLSFVGGLAGDDGAYVASFLQKRCAAELLAFLAPANSTSPTNRAPTRRRAVVGAAGLELPVLEGYVGHLCLCRHVSDTTAASHLLWLSRQALVALRLLDGTSPFGTAHSPQRSQEISSVLRSLSHALALLLTRPKRGNGSTSDVPDTTGNLLEILFDSDSRPLADLPRPLAEAVLVVLQKSGFLQLARPDVLLGLHSPLALEQVDTVARIDTSATLADSKAGFAGVSFSSGVDFRMASFAFHRSWALAAAGVDSHLPLIKRHKRDLDGSSDGDGGSDDSDDGESGGSCEDELARENGWGSVPDEVALRVFSFMTPKRVCRLMCVDRAWRELLLVERVWKPLFEARWPLKEMKDDGDLARASEKLLETIGWEGDAKRKRKRGKYHVIHWQLLEDAGTAPPPQDWTALYRDRHRAERAARGKTAARTNFPWVVCPFLDCVSPLKSEFAVKRHVKTHKRPPEKRRVAKKSSRPKKKTEKAPTAATTAG